MGCGELCQDGAGQEECASACSATCDNTFQTTNFVRACRDLFQDSSDCDGDGVITANEKSVRSQCGACVDIVQDKCDFSCFGHSDCLSVMVGYTGGAADLEDFGGGDFDLQVHYADCEDEFGLQGWEYLELGVTALLGVWGALQNAWCGIEEAVCWLFGCDPDCGFDWESARDHLYDICNSPCFDCQTKQNQLGSTPARRMSRCSATPSSHGRGPTKTPLPAVR